MHKIEQHIEDILNKYPASKYIVACSAGVDSTVLLYALKRLNLPVLIAHVNYHLRGEDSNEDQKFLEEIAEHENLEIAIKSIDLNKELKDGGNLQQLARQVRYDFFEDLRTANPGSAIVLGHHLEDQSETFFINLSRNSGVMGLSTMPEERDNIIRPLLTISKTELINYAEETGIKWREDASNQSLKYTRNIWRNKLLPYLRAEIPGLDDSVQTLVSHFQELQSNLETSVKNLVEEIESSQTLPKGVFDRLNSHEKVELCRQLGQSHKILTTWEDLKLKGTKVELEPNETCAFTSIVFNGNSYSFLKKENENLPELNIERCNKLPKSFSKSVVFLDQSKIQGDLIVRKPQLGDRIQPIGMKGSRLVSDVISDAKLTALEKQNVVVITDSKKILWIPEHCVSRNAIANSESTEIIAVSLIP